MSKETRVTEDTNFCLKRYSYLALVDATQFCTVEAQSSFSLIGVKYNINNLSYNIFYAAG